MLTPCLLMTTQTVLGMLASSVCCEETRERSHHWHGNIFRICVFFPDDSLSLQRRCSRTLANLKWFSGSRFWPPALWFRCARCKSRWCAAGDVKSKRKSSARVVFCRRVVFCNFTCLPLPSSSRQRAWFWSRRQGSAPSAFWGSRQTASCLNPPQLWRAARPGPSCPIWYTCGSRAGTWTAPARGHSQRNPSLKKCAEKKSKKPTDVRSPCHGLPAGSEKWGLPPNLCRGSHWTRASFSSTPGRACWRPGYLRGQIFKL